MSARNTPEAKRARRLRRSLTVSPPGYVDLVDYVKDRVHCSTGKAVKIILTGCLRVDSHTIGVEKLSNGQSRLVRCIPSDIARRMVVEMPEALRD